MEEVHMLSLDEFIPYRLAVASESVSQLMASQFRLEFNISLQEWRVLARLREVTSLPQNLLAQQTFLDKVTVSRAAANLCRRRYLTRNVHMFDGRSHFLSLTQEGLNLADLLIERSRALELEVLGDFCEDERQILADCLRRLQVNAIRGNRPLTTSEKDRVLEPA